MAEIEKNNQFMDLLSIISLINFARDVEEISDYASKYLNNFFETIENRIYLFTTDEKLKISENEDTISLLDTTALHLQEEGIIDFALTDSIPKIIINTHSETGLIAPHILILPLTRDNAPIGILVSALSQQNNDLDIEQNQLIVYLAENISVAISAIEKQKELVIANSKLFELSRMALLSARNASIGEITAAIASEFSLPIRVINTNLELLKSGVGDTNIRFEIIKTQLNKISDVIQKLLNLSETYSGNMSVERINVVETIDDVLFFISSQFNRNGIEISKKNVSTEPFIYCSKPIFEQILMNLLLVLKDNMTDNGRIDINVFDEKRATVSILISGDGNGIPQYFDQSGFLPELLDDKDYYKAELSLELISSLIKEIGGKIKITSIPYNGTTVKITFSKREKK